MVIDRARMVLSENETYPINELARDLGFSDVSTFTHFFSTRVGCSPTEFRKKYYQ